MLKICIFEKCMCYPNDTRNVVAILASFGIYYHLRSPTGFRPTGLVTSAVETNRSRFCLLEEERRTRVTGPCSEKGVDFFCQRSDSANHSILFERTLKVVHQDV